MKLIYVGIIIPLFFSCSSSKSVLVKSNLDLTNYTSQYYDFSVIIFDLKNKHFFIFNDSLSKIPFSPASTFKIPNSIVALENDVVTDENFVLSWDSIIRSNPSWNRTQNLNFAFKNSTVWYFQEVARRIGYKRMTQGLQKIKYCDTSFKIDNDIDKFWLNGNLKKSSYEQVLFMAELSAKTIKLRKNTYQTIEKIMASDTISDSKIYSKTGWALEGNEDIGWFVGYVKKGTNKYAFSTLIKTKYYEKVDIANLRKEITFCALKTIGITN